VNLVDFVSGACRAGVDLIQIRERDLDAGELTRLVKQCVAAANGTSTSIVVNDRLDVALSAGAHGVHLRGDSIEAERVRELAPPGFIVGRSVHGVEEAANVKRAGGVDYLLFGTMFPTASKHPSHPLATMTGLAATCALVSIPVLAIGGITAERAEDTVRMGAAGIAAIGFFLPDGRIPVDDHLHARVAELRRVFDTCEAVP
jgi:thiamine-phosphate pyrophosphorylase